MGTPFALLTPGLERVCGMRLGQCPWTPARFAGVELGRLTPEGFPDTGIPFTLLTPGLERMDGICRGQRPPGALVPAVVCFSLRGVIQCPYHSPQGGAP